MLHITPQRNMTQPQKKRSLELMDKPSSSSFSLSQIDQNLRNESLNESALEEFSFVDHIVSTDDPDFNTLTVLKVALYHPGTKSTEERVISKRAFSQLHQAKSAWKKFKKRPTTKELKKHKAEGQARSQSLLLPTALASASHLDPSSAPRRLRRAEKGNPNQLKPL